MDQSIGKSSRELNNIDQDAMPFIGAVAFGSRALGINSKWADYDFAVTRDIAEKLLESKHSYKVLAIEDYFNIVPKSGLNVLVRGLATKDGNELDLLILEKKSDLEIVSKSVEDIKKMDPLYLSIKKNRIMEYQKALKRNGWKYKDISTAFKLKLKGYP